MPKSGLPYHIDFNGGTPHRRSPGKALVTVRSPPDPEPTKGMIEKSGNSGKAPPPPPPKPTPIPKKYGDVATSGLKYTVVKGENTYNIELSSK